MLLILAVDNALLSFFTKLARSFARLTGRSNFFLAKYMICIMIASAMVETMNYWIPLLGRKITPLEVAFRGLFALLCLIDLNQCDKAEGAAFQERRVRVFSPILYMPCFRIYITLSSFLTIPIAVHYFTSAEGMFLAKIISRSWGFAFVAYVYLITIDPPSVGKSKIQEWAEGFTNFFRKPVPIPVKSK